MSLTASCPSAFTLRYSTALSLIHIFADAKKRVGGKLFLKGNMDSVNVLLNATPESLEEYVKTMLRDGAPGGGYILSSACSVAPGVKPEILKMLVPLAEMYGRYDDNGKA